MVAAAAAAVVVVPPAAVAAVAVRRTVSGGSGGHGGAGGAGGIGGSGGKGGAGGSGGAGGGAFEIIALGNLAVGESSYLARGGAGAAGDPALVTPTVGEIGDPGAGGGNGSTSGADGGDGGDGAPGGTGGPGGAGGLGGAGSGGAGGTIKLFGSTVTADPISVNTLGGVGPGSAGDGGLGRFLFGSNIPVSLGGSSIDARVEGFDGVRGANPFLTDNGETPFIPGLEGGPELFGLIDVGARELLALDVFANAPPGTGAVLIRADVGPGEFDDDFVGYDVLLFANVSDSAIATPQLGAGGGGHLQPLLLGGLNRSPIFGTSAEALTELAAGQVYITLIPEDTTAVSIADALVTASTTVLADGEVLYLAAGADATPLARVFAPAANQNLNISFTPNLAPVIASVGAPTDSPVSLKFDGIDDYVFIPQSADFDFDATMTAEAWIKPTGVGSGGVNGGIIVNSEGAFEVARFADGTIRWAFGNASPGWNWIDTGHVAELNEWTHIAVSYDANIGQVRTYADGVLVHSRGITGNIGDVLPADPFNDFWIGGRPATTQHFDGLINDVRLFDTARSQAQIQQDMATPIGPGTAGLVAGWRLGQGADDKIVDASGNGHTGVLATAPSIASRCSRSTW